MSFDSLASLNIKYAGCTLMTGGETPPLRVWIPQENRQIDNSFFNMAKGKCVSPGTT